MKKVYIVLLYIILCAYPAHTMETLPNEVIRMLFESMPYHQRMSVSRVCKMWRYLIATFPVPQLAEEFKRNSCFSERDYKLHVSREANKNSLHLDVDTWCFFHYKPEVIDADAQKQLDSVTTMRYVHTGHPIDGDLISMAEHVLQKDKRFVAVKSPVKRLTTDFFGMLNNYPNITNLWIVAPDQNALNNLQHSNTFENVTLEYAGFYYGGAVPEPLPSHLDALCDNQIIKRLILLFSAISQCSTCYADRLTHLINEHKTLLELKIGVADFPGWLPNIMDDMAKKWIDALECASPCLKLHFQKNCFNCNFIEKHKDNPRIVFFEPSSIAWE